MKKLFGMALAFSFMLATINTSLAQQRTVSVEQDKAEIKKIFSDTARAIMDFPRTHDVEGNLRFYAKEYYEVEDGKISTLADMKRNMEFILEQLKLGRQVVFFVQYSNISIEVNGNMAWATYDATVKYGTDRTLMATENKKCTSIFKRIGSSWLIVHDHNSSVKEAPSATPRMDNN